MSDNKLLQKPSQNLSKSTSDSKPNDKQKSNKEVNDNESSKMTPQYQNKDDYKDAVINGFQLDSVLPEDGQSHRKTKHKSKQYNREIIQEEKREKVPDKKTRYESLWDSWDAWGNDN